MNFKKLKLKTEKFTPENEKSAFFSVFSRFCYPFSFVTFFSWNWLGYCFKTRKKRFKQTIKNKKHFFAESSPTKVVCKVARRWRSWPFHIFIYVLWKQNGGRAHLHHNTGPGNTFYSTDEKQKKTKIFLTPKTKNFSCVFCYRGRRWLKNCAIVRSKKPRVYRKLSNLVT